MEVVFWLDKPPFACKGAFDEFSNIWDGQVFYACMKNISGIQTTINCNFNVKNVNAKLVIFENEKISPQMFAMNHKDAIHVFNGYKSLTKDVLLYLKKEEQNAKIVLWGEESRASKRYRYLPAFLKLIKEKEYKYYSAITDAFLVIGKQGITDYAKLGWDYSKMFPFFYCSVDNSKKNEHLQPNSPLKFLYLGRFDYRDKGIDILFRALKIIKNKRFTITFAGGYGEKANEIKTKIKRDERAFLDGPQSIEKCYDYFQHFDVCVSPARADSWSGQISTALLSGVPVIASDRCGNDFLIKDGYNGFVFRAGDHRSLAMYMERFINEAVDLRQMKINSQKSGMLIKPKRIANYLSDILKYLYFDSRERPFLDMSVGDNDD